MPRCWLVSRGSIARRFKSVFFRFVPGSSLAYSFSCSVLWLPCRFLKKAALFGCAFFLRRVFRTVFAAGDPVFVNQGEPHERDDDFGQRPHESGLVSL